MSHDDASQTSRIASEWLTLAAAASLPVQRALDDIAARSNELAADFYAHMLDDAQASQFLTNEQVHSKLFSALQAWLKKVLTPPGPGEMGEYIGIQKRIGDVHARINIPINLVASGARRLKSRIFEMLCAAPLDADTRTQGIVYASHVLDLALEVMSASYAQSRELSAKSDEAYRLHSLIHDIGTERERQRAALLDWENEFVYRIATGTGLAGIQSLTGSEFGRWFNHRGRPSFGGCEDANTTTALINHVDQLLSAGGQQTSNAYLSEILPLVRDDVAQIKFLLANLFAQLCELEAGRDSLTQLLNRRFVGTILSHEVTLARQRKNPFVIVMMDIDHFKSINDSYGHGAGDDVLRKVASVLMESLRPIDFIFRYGGEEFLLVLVETDARLALSVIERLRARLEQETIVFSADKAISLTASFGIALYDGHPDYQRTIDAADTALYRAKTNGRNRIEIAD